MWARAPALTPCPRACVRTEQFVEKSSCEQQQQGLASLDLASLDAHGDFSSSGSAPVVCTEPLIPTNPGAPSEEMAKISCSLETKDLWDKFHELGTEMIITKSGRYKRQRGFVL